MKIASFVRNGLIDCGLVEENGFRILDQHPEFSSIPSESLLLKLLSLSPEARQKISTDLKNSLVIPATSVKLLAALPLYIFAHQGYLERPHPKFMGQPLLLAAVELRRMRESAAS